MVSVVLKSGTNRFHGSFYNYYRDEALNANTFDANRGGRAKAGLYWNQPGLTVDGPVRIPGLYDGTNRTFFMYNWEQIRSEVPARAHELGPRPFERDLNNFQPRFGAAYRVNERTVLRGGYALSYLPTFDHGYNHGFSVTASLVASTDGNIPPVGDLSNPGEHDRGRAVGAARGTAAGAVLVGDPRPGQSNP